MAKREKPIATITVAVPRVGVPAISIDNPLALNAAKIEGLELRIYREVLAARAAALNEMRKSEELEHESEE